MCCQLLQVSKLGRILNVVEQLLLVLSVSAGISCGTTNPFEKRVELTDDEKVRVALDAGDLAQARTILESQIAAEPSNYTRHALLGAVYASLGGLDLLGAVKSSSSSGGSSNGSAIDQVDGFLPKTTTANELDLMSKAVNVLRAIPEDKRSTTSTERYSSSALIQLSLYQIVYGVMYLRQFLTVTTDNKYDPDKLRTMSADDATIILTQITAATVGSPMESKAKETLDAINGTSGNDQREKLINYMEAQKNK